MKAQTHTHTHKHIYIFKTKDSVQSYTQDACYSIFAIVIFSHTLVFSAIMPETALVENTHKNTHISILTTQYLCKYIYVDCYQPLLI